MDDTLNADQETCPECGGPLVVDNSQPVLDVFSGIQTVECQACGAIFGRWKS